MVNDLAKDNISKLFIKYSYPAVIGMLISGIYAIVDGIFIGQGVGQIGLASVAIALPALYFNAALALLVGLGTSAQIAINLGKGQKDKAKRYLGSGIGLAIILSIVITLTSLVFLRPLMILFGGKGEILEMAIDYGRVIFAGTIAQIFSLSLDSLVRNDGKPNLAMKTMIVGAITNIVLDYLFVMKFNGGVVGAAVATISGQCLVSAILLGNFFSKSSSLRLTLRDISFDTKFIMDIIKSGIPSFGAQFSLSLVLIIHNNLFMTYGTSLDISTYGIVGYVFSLFYVVFIGLSQGIQPLIGYNYGAKKYERVKEILKLASIVSLAFGVIGVSIIYIFPEEIASIFNNKNIELVKNTAIALKIYLIGLPAVGFVLVSASYFQSVVKDLYANITALGRSFIFLVPLLFILPQYLGIKGIWFATPAADFIGFLVTILLLKKDMGRLGINKNIKQKPPIKEAI